MTKSFQLKNEILSNLDFHEIYRSEIIKFKVSKNNGQATGRCPFHEDSNPSFSVNLKNGVFYCHGCGAKGSVFDFFMKKNNIDFKTSLLRLADIAGVKSQKNKKPRVNKYRKLVATYDYTDENNNLLFQACRFEPKGFSQRRPHPNKKGSWIKNITGVDLVPYRLPELIQAKTVFLVEGEKDADLVASLGLTASCNPMGAGKWRDEFKQHFKDKEVIILADNDDQGREHAEQVANSVCETAEVVKVIELPGLPEKGDVSDWANNGHGKAELLSLAKVAKEWIPKKETSLSDKSEFFEGTRFVPTAVVDNIIRRYDIFHDGSSFYFYNKDRGVWLFQHDNFVGKIIKDALANKSRRNYIQDVMKQVEYETYKTPDELMQNHKLINLSNGMLDIQNGKLLLHDKEYYSKVQIPIAFNPNAKCTRYLQFLEEVFLDDPIKIDALQDFSGYCLYPEIFIHEALFLIGSGANGKSVFLNVLTKVIGKENVSALEPQQFSNKFLLGSLKDRLLNVSSEIQTKSRIDSSISKRVITGDLVQADIKYKDPFTFRPIAKHIFSMNEIPIITDRTYAMKRRLIILKFNQTFFGKKEDKRLESKLAGKLSGVLNWCLVGLTRVLKNESITMSEQMIEDKKAFIGAMNPVLHFVDAVCVLKEEALVLKDNLYQKYKSWCCELGLRPLSKNKFYEQLLSDFPRIVKTRPDGGARHFKGIGLLIE